MDWNERIVELAKAEQYAKELETKHADILVTIKTAQNRARQLREALRDDAQGWFLETGEKKLHDALDVRLVMGHQLTEQDIFINTLRAISHAPDLLILDQKRLLSLWRTGDANWASVTSVRKPTPYLSTRLGEYLYAQPEEAPATDSEGDQGLHRSA